MTVTRLKDSIVKKYSNYQKKVIKRYYDNREQLDEQRLSELVTSLYLAKEKAKEKMWVTAREIMSRLKVPESRIDHVVGTGDPAILAEVVKDIQSGVIGK